MGRTDLHALQSAGTFSRAQNARESGPMALRKGRIHEAYGPGADMFAITAAARQACDVVWIGLYRDIGNLCPSGLQAYLNIDGLIIVEGVSRGELLWAADQALRAEGGFCVILEMPDTLSLKESRRLQLAAEQGGGLGLLILRGGVSTSAAQTRWKCAPMTAEDPTWDWHCEKDKNGQTGRWRVTYQRGQNAEDTLHIAATAPA